MNAITDYWLKHYAHHGHCALCGNHGVIDTTGTKTPAGLPAGRKNFCICPNGQIDRSINEESPLEPPKLSDDERAFLELHIERLKWWSRASKESVKELATVRGLLRRLT
jgi:hypothetical protein